MKNYHNPPRRLHRPQPIAIPRNDQVHNGSPVCGSVRSLGNSGVCTFRDALK